MSRPLHRLRLPAEVATRIRGLHPQLKRQVRAALAAILADPGVGKPLVRELAGLRSFRLGRLRIVYRVAAGRIVELAALGPRRTIYELTLRLAGKDANRAT